MKHYTTLVFDLHEVVVRKRRFAMLWVLLKNAYRLDLIVRILHPKALWLLFKLSQKSRVPEEYAYRLIEYNPKLADVMPIIIEFSNQQKMQKGMIPFLYQLKQKYRLVIFSNIGKTTWHKLVEHMPVLEDIFEIAVTAHADDDWLQKPAAASFEKCLQVVKENPDHILFIDDKAKNCAQARKHGMKAHQFKHLADLENIFY